MAGTDDISALLGLLSGSSDSSGTGDGSGQDSGIFGDIDPEMLMKLLEIVSKLGSDDKNTALLTALRPHLRPENRQKLDRAERLMKLVSVLELLRESGLGDELFG